MGRWRRYRRRGQATDLCKPDTLAAELGNNVISRSIRLQFEFAGRGAGTRDVRIRDASGIFRVMYVAKFEAAVYVLHRFQKKTRATSQRGKDIATTRYRAVANARKATP